MDKKSLNMRRTIKHLAGSTRRLVFVPRPIISSEATKIVRVKYSLARFSGYAIMAGLATAVLLNDISGPDKVILILGLIALVLRIVNGLFFGVALTLLVYMPILQATGHIDASNSFAVYTFYCLCFGIASAILQLPRDNDEESD